MVAVLSSVAGRITLCQNPAEGMMVRYRGILSGEKTHFSPFGFQVAREQAGLPSQDWPG